MSLRCWYLCVTASHDKTGMNKHREMKINPTSKPQQSLDYFFRYGFKIFYPIWCSLKRSADVSILYKCIVLVKRPKKVFTINAVK